MANMLELFEVFEDSSCFYTVTRYMPEGDLHQMLNQVYKKSALAESQVKSIIRQVVVAVQGLHAKNILHRDIKLDNILVLRNGP